VTIAVSKSSLATDKIAPVITLNGSAEMALKVNEEYVEPGATAEDNVDGNITSEIVTLGSVDVTTASEYTITYNVADAAGNKAEEKIRTVTVTKTADAEPPVITLKGTPEFTIKVGQAYTEYGATAKDNIDGDISGSIEISGSVNNTSPGYYEITYNVSDAAGNAAEEKIRTITVEALPEAEHVLTLVLNGDAEMTLQLNQAYQEPGAAASCSVCGDVEVAIAGSVDHKTPGSYTITYTATDAAGNTSEKTRTVTVESDKEPPALQLVGPEIITLYLGYEYTEPGATANDNIDGDISSKVAIAGSVDINSPGDYPITYNVTDNAGNAAPEVIRTVTVKDLPPPAVWPPVPIDAEPPEIILHKNGLFPHFKSASV